MDKAPKHLGTALKRTLAEGMNKEGADKTDNKAGESAGGLKRKRREGRFRRLIFLTLVPAIAILGIIITMLRTGSSESAMKDLPALST